ncbi:recombinase family protein [Salmonella enterica]|uniref:recombinase family protein n=1 Tax=Salmonella enterica TaxID=28901 RepID=UPI003BD58745
MSRIFAYCRVSKIESDTDNQKLEIKSAGFDVAPHRCIEEQISGSIPSEQRPQFQRLVDRLEPGDVLVVTKLDRLGRNAMDVRTTIERLKKSEIHIHCLQLGGVDLTSSAGKLIMQVIAAQAEFERDLLIERTQAGLDRVKASGRRLGRPSALSDEQQDEVAERLATGESISSIARAFSTTRQTIIRLRSKLEKSATDTPDVQPESSFNQSE